MSYFVRSQRSDQRVYYLRNARIESINPGFDQFCDTKILKGLYYIHTKQLSDLESSFLKYSYLLFSNLGLGDERTHLWPNEPIGDHGEYWKPPRIGIGYEIGHYGGQEVLETIIWVKQ